MQLISVYHPLCGQIFSASSSHTASTRCLWMRFVLWWTIGLLGWPFSLSFSFVSSLPCLSDVRLWNGTQNSEIPLWPQTYVGATWMLETANTLDCLDSTNQLFLKARHTQLHTCDCSNVVPSAYLLSIWTHSSDSQLESKNTHLGL